MQIGRCRLDTKIRSHIHLLDLNFSLWGVNFTQSRTTFISREQQSRMESSMNVHVNNLWLFLTIRKDPFEPHPDRTLITVLFVFKVLLLLWKYPTLQNPIRTYSTFHVLICGVACSRAAWARPVGAMHAGGTGRIRQTKEKKRKKKQSFQHKNPSKWRKRHAPRHWLQHCTRPICFVPSYLPLPSEGEPLGAILGPSFRSHGPLFLATAFKVLHCDVHGLDVCLVPYMQSYHYPCLLTIAGPVFVTSAALRLGLWHDCTVDLFSFTYRSLCLSFFLFFCTQTVHRVWI